MQIIMETNRKKLLSVADSLSCLESVEIGTVLYDRGQLIEGDIPEFEDIIMISLDEEHILGYSDDLTLLKDLILHPIDW